MQAVFGEGGDAEVDCPSLANPSSLINSPSYILRATSARTDRGNGPGVISGQKLAPGFGGGRQVRGADRRPCT